jgi:DnaJ-class molecular chaperone
MSTPRPRLWCISCGGRGTVDWPMVHELVFLDRRCRTCDGHGTIPAPLPLPPPEAI